MDRRRVKAILNRVRRGTLSVGEAVEQLRRLPYADLGDAKVDTHRALRRGVPEAVYCPGKSDRQIVRILRELSEGHRVVIATRATEATQRVVRDALPDKVVSFHPDARLIVVGPAPRRKRGKVVVVTAGTSDIPVAEEAAVTAETLGNRVVRLYDVGVAGVHRLLDRQDAFRDARVAVVVAGMEGALPSVVSGLVDIPVVAVPTSVGYGASFDGLAALLAMMNSCSPGVAVVNIDNGYGAGVLASMLNR